GKAALEHDSTHATRVVRFLRLEPVFPKPCKESPSWLLPIPNRTRSAHRLSVAASCTPDHHAVSRFLQPPKGTPMTKTQAKAPNALTMLKEDHDKVKDAFKQFESLDREDVATCRELVESVCADLRVHTLLEEEIVYPAVRAAIGDEDLMNEAAIEHETAKTLIE